MPKNKKCQFRSNLVEDYTCPEPVIEGSDCCIFHKPDKTKDEAKLFQKKIEEKLRNKDYDFTGFRFPEKTSLARKVFVRTTKFTESTFQVYAYFRGSTFEGYADFRESTFEGYADFPGSTFEGDADFPGSTFEGDAYFPGSTFEGDAYFRKSTFHGYAYFRESTFKRKTDFKGAFFKERADFRECTFKGPANFRGSTFKDSGSFKKSTFKGRADFRRSAFKGLPYAYFGECTFEKASLFKACTFEGAASFESSSFEASINFRGSTFKGPYDFIESTFKGRANFRGSTFKDSGDFEKSTFKGRADFRRSAFKKPASFKESTFEKPVFFERWDEFALSSFEEVIHLDHVNFKVPGGVDALIRKAKIAWHREGNYVEEGKCHYQEMDHIRKQQNWFVRYVWGNLAHRLLHGYGEHPGRVIAWAGVIITTCALLFMNFGIGETRFFVENLPTYNIFKILPKLYTLSWDDLANIGRYFYFSVVTFTTLGYGDLRPVHPVSHLISSIEAFVGMFMMALFVLTFGRKWRR